MTMMQGLSLTGVPVSATAKKRGELWLHDCLSHVNSMHKLLAYLYDGLETDNAYDVDDEDDDSMLTEGDSTKACHIYADHCYKLVKRMTNPTNGPVEFPLTQIITVLSRCLSLSYSDVLSVPSRTDLATLLPQLHQGSMDVLSQLILCCGRDTLHHSRTITDLCLQTIISTTKMPVDDKYRTRSSCYQALVLWVKTCGWGKYLSTHRKLLIQEIMTDTQADEEDGLAKKSGSDESNTKHEKLSKKEKKGKRKKGHRGDSYMELETKEEEKGKEQNNEARVDLVMWAFSLSQLVVENLPFSLSQNLIAHLIKTASTVQKSSSKKPQPYSQIEARKGLYQAVAGCLLSPLESSGNRNDAVCHYQMTNSALDLLVRASHGDHSQIQTVCSQALALMKSSANLKGPVIRKVLDYDDTGVEDVSQLLRENEQQSDCIEGLRQRLMNSEMENEQQSRLISSLKEQITNLQNKVSSVNQESGPVTASRLSQADKLPNKNDDNNDDDDEEEGEKDVDSDVNETNVEEDEGMNTSGGDEPEISVAVVKSNSMQPGSHLEEKLPKIDVSDKPKTSSSVVGRDSGAKNKDFEKKAGFDDSKMTPKKSVKRINDAETSFEKDLKRSKVELKEKADSNIEDMLMDFVDAPPDI